MDSVFAVRHCNGGQQLVLVAQFGSHYMSALPHIDSSHYHANCSSSGGQAAVALYQDGHGTGKTREFGC